MSKRDYPRLPIEEFGRHLLVSGDLDPVYIALYRVMTPGHGRRAWPVEQVQRWLVAYWCLYHCGAASYLSTMTGETFWAWLLKAAENEVAAPTGGRWPRGHERRHWRGQQAVDSLNELAGRYGRPEEMVHNILNAGHDFADVAERVRVHRGFGPWIAFKVCDMLDRVLGHKVDFTEAAVFMFKDPVEAALRVWREKAGVPDRFQPKNRQVRDQIIHTVVGHLEGVFAGMTAPPLHDRSIELQEVETILCKWKSHMNGHYPLNNDIDEINAGLEGWGDAAAEFGAAMPERLP